MNEALTRPHARAGTNDGIAFGAAYFFSAFGYEVLFFIMTLRVYDVSRNAINVGVFTAITFLPKLLSPAYGALVDRFGAKSSIVAAAATTAILALLLPLVHPLWAIYALWVPFSGLFMLLSNARTVLMTQVSTAGGYVGGNALAFSLLNAARLAAPLSAGFLSRLPGSGHVAALAACAYALCAASTLVLSRKGHRETPPGTLREGFERIVASDRLRLLVCVSAIRSLFLGFMPSVLVVIVARRFGGANVEYGIAMSAAALGSLAGGLAGPPIARLAAHRYVAALGLGVHFVCFAGLGIVPSFVSAVGVLAVGSFALYAAAVVLHAQRDAATELATRGRVYGANTSLQTVASLASMIVGSALAHRFGAGPVFLASGTAAVVVLAVVSARMSATMRGPQAFQ